MSCITAQVSILPLLQPPLSYTAPELAGNGMQRADITLTSSADVFSLGEACLFRFSLQEVILLQVAPTQHAPAQRTS